MFGVRRCKFVLRKCNISLEDETVVDSEYSVVTESYFLNQGAVRIKEPIGHITHLRHQFTSINTFEKSYDLSLIRDHYLFFVNWVILIRKNLSLLHWRMLYAKFGWNWPNGSGEFLKNFHQCILAILALHFNKFESPSPKNA